MLLNSSEQDWKRMLSNNTLVSKIKELAISDGEMELFNNQEDVTQNDKTVIVKFSKRLLKSFG